MFIWRIIVAMKALWKTMLDGASEEALLAVDLYNQPSQPRRLEGFLVHMHIAWTYLLQTEFRKDGKDYYYRLPNGRFEKVDGEPKAWDLSRCVEERWSDASPVQKNLELTIALRNKIEHHYQEAITLVTSGYAQALLLNFEDELTTKFGEGRTLGDRLRFPVFVGDITPLGNTRIKELRGALPKKTRDFLARFEAGLAADIAQDQRYEFRVTLVPKTGAKTEADRAISFVRDTDLTEEQKKAFQSLGTSGNVIVREQVRPVASADKLRPSTATTKIQEQIPFQFRVSHFVRAWKKLAVRPATGDPRPERTIEKYCVYDIPHKDYLYTEAFIEKVVREASTKDKFKTLTGLTPEDKA